tara:strand:+ start:3227 stop:4921 length:1695 start_codon:yes stop_codon:yes gene_type:complete
MEKTFILGDEKSSNFENYNFIRIPVEDFISESEIHNWVCKLFQSNDIEKIIIQIDDKCKVAAQIAYHIRLSITELKEKVLVPILFISDFSLESQIKEFGQYAHILFTKGLYYFEFNEESFNEEVSVIEGLPVSDYVLCFLDLVKVSPVEKKGRHSLGNEWGAHILNEVSGVNCLTSERIFLKTLFFKFKNAPNNIDKLNPSGITTKGYINLDSKSISAKAKKILLIDDEADRGWDSIMRGILKTDSSSDFITIKERVTGYNDFSEKSKSIIENGDFDLFLVDLRLGGDSESSSKVGGTLSGMDVIKKLKSINKGNQIIVLSASNKVWNLKSLIKLGVSGYYLKESPEDGFKRSVSTENYNQFKEIVNDCFSKGYLRKVYNLISNVRSIHSKSKFQKYSDTGMEIAWNQIEQGNLDFGFLSLFQIIEKFGNENFKFNRSSNEYSVNGVTVIKNKTQQESEWVLKHKRNGDIGYFISEDNNIKAETRPSALFKTSCVFKFILGKNDNELKKLGDLNWKRNKIAHGERKIMNSEDDIIELLTAINELMKHTGEKSKDYSNKKFLAKN